MSRKSKGFKDNKQKRDGNGFITLPHVVLNSPSFIDLNPSAIKLLIDMYSQYNGFNNGYLCASFTLMQQRKWKSKETLQKAKNELIASGLIVETRKGSRPNKASYYAVTWYALDEQNGKTGLDMATQSFPRGLYTHPQDYKNHLLAPIIVPMNKQ